MPINSLNCNQSFAVMICVILICGNFVMQLMNHLYLIAAMEECVLLKGRRRWALPGLTAPNFISLVFSVIWLSCKWAGVLCFALSGRIKIQEAVAVKWLMAANMRMLAMSVQFWLARHDVLNNVCHTDFSQKLFENQNQPWYIQWHQDHSWWFESHRVWPGYILHEPHSWIYAVKASGIHVYCSQVLPVWPQSISGLLARDLC